MTDSQLAGIGYYYKQLASTRNVIQEFRTHYPTSTIVMINDGGDERIDEVAKEYQAIYHPYPNVKPKFATVPDMLEWVQRIFTALEHIQEEYCMILEDDVTFIRKPIIEGLVGVMVGYNTQNYIPEHITNYIKEHNTNIPLETKRVRYSGYGGTLLRTAFWQFISKQNWKEELVRYADITKVKNPDREQTWNFNDCVLSFLCFRYGGTITQNPEWGEIPDGYRRSQFLNGPYAILHRYKELYV